MQISKINRYVLWIWLGAVSAGLCDYGPFSLYTNKLNGEFSSFSGSYSYTTDCCESGSATITPQGPIDVTVTPSLSIGANETQNWSGTIKPQMSGAPEPGSTVNASFKIDYVRNYWTTDGTPLPQRNGSATVQFVVYGVKVDLPEKVAICKGGKTTVTANEFPAGGSYEWSTTDNNITLSNTDQKTVTVTANGNRTGRAKIKCVYTIEGVTAEKETEVVLFELKVKLAKARACDGEEVEVQISSSPVLPAATLAGCLQNLAIEAKPSKNSQGNPIGHTDLPIEPVDMNTLKTKITNAIWYATQGDGCNNASQYKIKATATCTCDEGNIESDEANLTVSADIPNCLNGSAIPHAPFFSGEPKVNVTERQGGGYKVSIAKNTFKKDVQVKVTVSVPANSQFLQMAQGEEDFHANQFKGTSGIPAISGLWNADDIITNANNAVSGIGFGAAQQAYQAGVQAFNAAMNAEIARSATVSSTKAFRCALELEAKNAVPATHRASFACTYAKTLCK